MIDKTNIHKHITLLPDTFYRRGTNEIEYLHNTRDVRFIQTPATNSDLKVKMYIDENLREFYWTSFRKKRMTALSYFNFETFNYSQLWNQRTRIPLFGNIRIIAIFSSHTLHFCNGMRAK